jgi:hypothetical protein
VRKAVRVGDQRDVDDVVVPRDAQEAEAFHRRVAHGVTAAAHVADGDEER